jgi:sugar transferase (PEP-CTERM system associated)
VFSVLRRQISAATLVQLFIELCWLFAAGIVAIVFLERLAVPGLRAVAPQLVFAILIVALNVGFGLYQRNRELTTSAYLLRLVLTFAIAAALAYVIAEALPGGKVFQATLGVAVLLAIGGLLLLRHLIVMPLVGSLLPYRVLVLGTGPEARLVEASLAATHPSGMRIVGFHALEKAQRTLVSRRRIIANTGPLEETVRRLGVNEIIVAVREQRGGVLPLRSLLDCRLNGVRVTDLARFFERVHGKVPIELLKVSWLIYGDGYRQGWIRTTVKRSFDVIVSVLLLLVTLPLMAVTAILIALDGRGPIIYRQTRAGHRGKNFTVLKFRSMAPDAEKEGSPSWASIDDERVTRVGRFMRRTRIDELPQLINVLKGEMSFVGPRPERPEFVEMLTQQIPFYAVRHSVKPGITGWAQVRYSYGATVEQAVRKLEYDLYYVKNHTLVLDVLILLETVRVVMLGEGAR